MIVRPKHIAYVREALAWLLMAQEQTNAPQILIVATRLVLTLNVLQSTAQEQTGAPLAPNAHDLRLAAVQILKMLGIYLVLYPREYADSSFAKLSPTTLLTNVP